MPAIKELKRTLDVKTRSRISTPLQRGAANHDGRTKPFQRFPASTNWTVEPVAAPPRCVTRLKPGANEIQSMPRRPSAKKRPSAASTSAAALRRLGLGRLNSGVFCGEWVGLGGGLARL